MNFQVKSRFSNFGQDFAGPACTSPVMAISVLALLSIGTAFNELPSQPLAFQAMTGVAYQSLALGTIYFLFFAFLINVVAKKPSLIRTILVAILFFTTEMVRAIFVGFSVTKINPEISMDWSYRVVAGGVTGLTLFGVVSIILNNNRKYKENLSKLINTQENLRQSTRINETDLIEIKHEIISKIKAAIDSALAASVFSSSKTGGDEQSVVQELIRVSDQVVRPLSHELFESEYQFPKFQEIENPRNVSSRRVLVLSALNPFHPIPLIGIAFGLLVGNTLFGTENTTQAFIALALLLTSLFIFMFAAKKFITPILSKSSILLHVVVASLIFWFLHKIIVDLKFITEAFGIVKTDGSDFYIGLLSIILCWIIAIFYGVKESRSEVLSSLEESVKNLTWINARLGSQLWTERQHLASVVHRDVQGKLISTALKFQKEISENNPEAKNMLKENLKLLTSNLVAVPKSTVPSESIRNLNEIWDGVFRIHLEIPSDVEELISKDSVCSYALNDIFAEFATNSVKHGKASRGNINVSRFSDNSIKVVFTNNGAHFGLNPKPGLGSQMSAQQTLGVKRRNLDSGGIEIEAILPVA